VSIIIATTTTNTVRRHHNMKSTRILTIAQYFQHEAQKNDKVGTHLASEVTLSTRATVVLAPAILNSMSSVSNSIPFVHI
jgi:hypothetical protein